MTNNYNNLLFLSLLKKYKKYFSQLDKKIKNGTFAKMAAYQRQSLVKKVEQLRAKLNGFQLSALKYGAAAAFLLTVGTASAQGPFEFNYQKNPFPKSEGRTDIIDYDASGYETSTFADLDNDGDLDMVGGNYYDFVYFQNNGTASVPDFVQQTGTNNPFDGFSSSSSRVVPTLGDFDNDGDFDMVSGIGNGGFLYFENTGTASAPAFTELTGSFNPLGAFDLGHDSAPSAADIDGDGHLDLVVGSGTNGNVYCILNEVVGGDPTFMSVTGTENPFDGLNPVGVSRVCPTLVDLDNDGDLDASIGSFYSGTIRYYINTGSATLAVFAEQIGSDSPVWELDPGYSRQVHTTYADIDDDGDFDLFLAGLNNVLYYENFGTATAADFGSFDPGLSALTYARASLLAVDIDNDGDGDAFVGTYYGEVLYFENTGTVSAPVMTQRTGAANPLNAVSASYYSSLAAADIDGDGDKDVVVAGVYSEELYYFQNTGSASSPVFAELTGAFSPLPVVSGNENSVELADIDGDGDADLIVGRQNDILLFLRTGAASVPVFTAVTGTLNPFDGIGAGDDPSVALVNLDGDLDLDLVVGTQYGTVQYFTNTGSSSLPLFTEVTGTSNPFNTSVVAQSGDDVAPEFWDYDNDGDKDLFLGMQDGSILLYENKQVVTSVLTAGPSINATAVEVFPNPTVGSFTISVPSELSGAALITISDLSGRQLFSERRELQSGDLSYEQVLSDKQPGTYVLKIVMDNRVGVAKILKQ